METTAATQLLGHPITAFVEANEATNADEDFIFGQIEDFSVHEASEIVHKHHVEKLLSQVGQIGGNSGVGSPEVAKYVAAQAPALLNDAPKATTLQSLAEQLYVRRPVLFLKNHPEPVPATVLLRTARKPSVGALSTAVSAAGLFKFPNNSFIIIKFDPQFGYADIIVDPFFKDSFLQQPSTATYNALLEALPQAFVGTAAELRKLVALLTAESIRAYIDKGVSCPPWRRFDAVLARWLPKMYTDDVITHGPDAAGRTAKAASAALSPSLFAPPATTNRDPVFLHRRGSDDSTSSTSSTSTRESGVHPVYSPAMSESLSRITGSSSSSYNSSVNSYHSSGQLDTPGHRIIYGFDLPSNEQQPADQQHDEVAASELAIGLTAEAHVGSAVTHLAAAVSGKLAGAASKLPSTTAAAPADAADSIKAVYPAGSQPTKRVLQLDSVAKDSDGRGKMASAVGWTTAALQAKGRQQQQQRPATSSDIMTTQLLLDNGYGKPRVVKLGGAAACSKPAISAAGRPAAAVAPTACTAADQRVCHPSSRLFSSDSGMRVSSHHETPRPDALAAADYSTGAYVAGASMKGAPGYSSVKDVDFNRTLLSGTAEVRGLTAAVADYKDHITRTRQLCRSTRAVAGRKVVWLCSSPGGVVTSLVQYGASAA